jgi:hypothetical protein
MNNIYMSNNIIIINWFNLFKLFYYWIMW